MADETTATDTTETETSTTEATETDQTTTDKAADQTGADETADKGADKSLMNGGGKGPDDEDDSNVNDKGDDDAGKDALELPEKYELTPPEGFAVNDALLSEADPVFRDIGLTNEQAQKLMPLVPKFAEQLFAAQQDAFQAQATDWAKTAKADPEIGGKNWGETENLVAKALDKFAVGEGGKAFRALLDETKLGNHPEMIRIFRSVGAALGEDGDFARSDTGAPVKQAREAVLYPNDVPQKEGAN